MQNPSGHPSELLEHDLRAELARGDSILASARPVLRHLLLNDDHALLSDEVVASVRGMFAHISRQLLTALSRAVNVGDLASLFDEFGGQITSAIMQDSAFLAGAHARVIEAQTAERLQLRSGIDPVLSPLMQELSASADPAQASLAMRVLAAQARFIQQTRRMEWPLGELPPDLFDKAMTALEASSAANGDALAAVHATLRQAYDAGQRREAMIDQLIVRLQRKATRALAIDHAGLAIFSSGLAMATGHVRELTIMLVNENQIARLALSLRAAGLQPVDVTKQFQFLHPEIELPENFETLRPDRAAALLAASVAEARG